MLDTILEKQEQICAIASNHYIKECKVFGSAVNQNFPIKADVHFLVIPKEKGLDILHWQKLEENLKALFPGKHTVVYTPASLEKMVTLRKISQEAADLANNGALDFSQLQKLASERNQKKVNNEPNQSASLFINSTPIKKNATVSTINGNSDAEIPSDNKLDSVASIIVELITQSSCDPNKVLATVLEKLNLQTLNKKHTYP